MDARKSRDPVAIGRASQRVIALALVQMAKLRLDEKAYDDAKRLCEESLVFEDTAETRVEIAIASLYAKKPSEAIKETTVATEVDPQNALAWTIKGEALLQSQDYEPAAAAFRQALGIRQDAESLYGLGTAQLRSGEKQKAAEAFSQFLAVVGDSGWSRVLVGRAYHAQGMAQEAEAQFHKALDLDPSAPNAHYFWAISALQTNAWNSSPEVYSQLRAELQLNPRHFEANYMLGSLTSTARNYTESDRYLQLASQVKPSVPETWVLLGLNAQRRKSNQVAIAYFRKAIERGKDLDPKEHFELRKAYFGLGRLLLASGKTQEAEALFKKAKELEIQALEDNRKKFAATPASSEEATQTSDAPYVPESDPGRQLSLASSAPATDITVERSRSSKQKAVHSQADPEGKTERYLGVVLGASFNDLATAEALQEKYEEAFKHYREAERWDPYTPGLRRNLGLAAYFAGQPAEAIRLLEKVVLEAPADQHARAVLGLAYFSTGNFGKAAQTITPIAQQAVQDPQLGLAWATSLAQTGNRQAARQALDTLDKSGKLAEAIGLFEQAARVQPSNLSYHLGLETAYRKTGRSTEADHEHAIYVSLKAALEPAHRPLREQNPR